MTRPRAAVVWLLGAYKRWVSPLLPSACRYYPSCSEYARDAVEMHGIARGWWLATLRLTRCHPLADGGFDPVPPPKPRGQARNEPDPAV